MRNAADKFVEKIEKNIAKSMTLFSKIFLFFR